MNQGKLVSIYKVEKIGVISWNKENKKSWKLSHHSLFPFSLITLYTLQLRAVHQDYDPRADSVIRLPVITMAIMIDFTFTPWHTPLRHQNQSFNQTGGKLHCRLKQGSDVMTDLMTDEMTQQNQSFLIEGAHAQQCRMTNRSNDRCIEVLTH